MNAEIITIYCLDCSSFSLNFCAFVDRENLKNYAYKVEFCQNLFPVIDLTIDGRNVRLIVSPEQTKQCDVCIVGSWFSCAQFSYVEDSLRQNVDPANYCANVKNQASWSKQKYPESPTIVVWNASLKSDPRNLKDLELAGQKVLNKKMGDELARDIGAVKYVEFSSKSGRGVKTIIDEIVLAHFSKLKDEEDRGRMKKEADKVQRERTKRNLFIFEKFLHVLHYM